MSLPTWDFTIVTTLEGGKEFTKKHTDILLDDIAMLLPKEGDFDDDVKIVMTAERKKA